MGSVILLGVLADQQFSGSGLGRRKALAEPAQPQPQPDRAV
jgi:hypothetical protein